MKMNMDHVHVKTKSMARSNSTKMACEKASRRLRATLLKASRLGVEATEVARLPAAKKLIPERDHGWRLAVFMILMFGGGVVVALVCMAKNGCTRIEDILIIERTQDIITMKFVILCTFFSLLIVLDPISSECCVPDYQIGHYNIPAAKLCKDGLMIGDWCCGKGACDSKCCNCTEFSNLAGISSQGSSLKIRDRMPAIAKVRNYSVGQDHEDGDTVNQVALEMEVSLNVETWYFQRVKLDRRDRKTSY